MGLAAVLMLLELLLFHLQLINLFFLYSSLSLLITFTESSLTVIGIGTAASNNSTTTSSFCRSILETLAFSLLNGPDIISTTSFFCILTCVFTCSNICSISLYSKDFLSNPLAYGT